MQQPQSQQPHTGVGGGGSSGEYHHPVAGAPYPSYAPPQPTTGGVGYAGYPTIMTGQPSQSQAQPGYYGGYPPSQPPQQPSQPWYGQGMIGGVGGGGGPPVASSYGAQYRQPNYPPPPTMQQSQAPPQHQQQQQQHHPMSSPNNTGQYWQGATPAAMVGGGGGSGGAIHSSYNTTQQYRSYPSPMMGAGGGSGYPQQQPGSTANTTLTASGTPSSATPGTMGNTTTIPTTSTTTTLPPLPQTRTRLSRPPYVDPVTNIVYDTDNADYEGWLTKQSTWLKEWRRRYFILKGSKLFFCKNEYSAPHGMMDLAQCTTVKSADLKSKKRHSLEISTPETCYLLYADTESEKDDWIGRVGKAIVRCSRTYYSNTGAGGTNTPNTTGQPYGMGGATGRFQSNNNNHNQNMPNAGDDDDDIYTNDDPNNPYFND